MDPIDEFLKKLRPGEPIFCLRGQDDTAPAILEAWAATVEYRANEGRPEADLIEARLRKANEARALAHEMRAWQVRNGSKVPD